MFELAAVPVSALIDLNQRSGFDSQNFINSFSFSYLFALKKGYFCIFFDWIVKTNSVQPLIRRGKINNIRTFIFVQIITQIYLTWILKKLFCLAASPKSVMVATNSAPNFDFEDFLVHKSTHIYKMSSIT